MTMNDSTIGYYILYFCIAVITIVFGTTPYLTRKNEAFGVSIPESQADHPVLSAFRKAYLKGVAYAGIAGGGASLLANVLFNEKIIIPFVAMFGIIAFSFVWYFKFYKKTLALKAAEGWQKNITSKVYVNINSPSEFAPSAWWLVFMPIIVLATAFITISIFPSLPQRIPSNFGYNGEITGYVNKSFWYVMMLPFIQTFMTVLFSFVLYISKRSRVTIDPQNEEASMKQAAAFKKGWGWFTILAGTAIVLMFCFLQFAMIGLIDPKNIVWFALPLPMGIIIGAIYLSFKLGQGGSRLGKKNGNDKILMRDDDKYWKLGMFYYNPDDPAVFVEKRFGIGWTSNFARPITYVYLGVLLVFIICMIAFSANVG